MLHQQIMIIPEVKNKKRTCLFCYIHDIVAKLLSHVLGCVAVTLEQIHHATLSNDHHATLSNDHLLWHFLLFFEFKTNSPPAIGFVRSIPNSTERHHWISDLLQGKEVLVNCIS